MTTATPVQKVPGAAIPLVFKRVEPLPAGTELPPATDALAGRKAQAVKLPPRPAAPAPPPPPPPVEPIPEPAPRSEIVVIVPCEPCPPSSAQQCPKCRHPFTTPRVDGKCPWCKEAIAQPPSDKLPQSIPVSIPTPRSDAATAARHDPAPAADLAPPSAKPEPPQYSTLEDWRHALRQTLDEVGSAVMLRRVSPDGYSREKITAAAKHWPEFRLELRPEPGVRGPGHMWLIRASLDDVPPASFVAKTGRALSPEQLAKYRERLRLAVPAVGSRMRLHKAITSGAAAPQVRHMIETGEWPEFSIETEASERGGSPAKVVVRKGDTDGVPSAVGPAAGHGVEQPPLSQGPAAGHPAVGACCLPGGVASQVPAPAATPAPTRPAPEPIAAASGNRRLREGLEWVLAKLEDDADELANAISVIRRLIGEAT